MRFLEILVLPFVCSALWPIAEKKADQSPKNVRNPILTSERPLL